MSKNEICFLFVFVKWHLCTVGQKKDTLISSNANYPREMKLIPTNMDHYLLQLMLDVFLVVRLNGGSLSYFNFFNVNPLI